MAKRYGFGGFARRMSDLSQSMPYSSTFAQSAARKRIERCSSFSSGGFGGRPIGFFASSMAAFCHNIS